MKNVKERLVNWLIKTLEVDMGKVSDGYHTFNDLYEHRIELWIALTKRLKSRGKVMVWKSTRHSDGSKLDGWFVLGYHQLEGKQITYHLPMRYWDRVKAHELDIAPMFDGHTSTDVVARLKKL